MNGIGTSSKAKVGPSDSSSSNMVADVVYDDVDAASEPINCTMLVVTEFTRWAVLVTAIYLSVWQYCTQVGYTVFVADSPIGVQGQFWAIFTAIMVGISLLFYLPWRLASWRFRIHNHILRDERWRPAIVFYIVFCAVPCFTLILTAYKITERIPLSPTAQLTLHHFGNVAVWIFCSHPSLTNLTPVSVTVLQMVVLGLVITEWAVKLQQEKFTYELVTAMALDFFFAYDVIAFVMMADPTPVYQSGWVYPTFVFAVVAMCKYIPTQPIGLVERGSSIGHVVCILTSMFCNDVPFVVIRLGTMIVFGFLISDMIFLMKNIFLIVFNIIQLSVIYSRLNHRPPPPPPQLASQPPTVADMQSNVVDSATARTESSNKWTVVANAVRDVGNKREFRFGPDDVWSDPTLAAGAKKRTSTFGSSRPTTAPGTQDANVSGLDGPGSQFQRGDVRLAVEEMDE